MALLITQIAVLNDNYVYLLRDDETDVVGAVDPGVAEPVADELERRGWSLDFILNTHHHNDHVGGNRALKERYGCHVIGPRYDAGRIPAIDDQVSEESGVRFGSHDVQVIFTPGHTHGHICYWFPKAEALFSGDTLFSLGCGRLFEGTPADMFASLRKLAKLPDETKVYCAHEYTEANARFALSIDPDNADLRRKYAKVAQLRARGQPTVPSTLAEERRCNPFLLAGDADEFGRIRALKDTFRG